MDELRSWWKVPNIAYFCSLFTEAFGLPSFDIEEFENALLETTESLVCPLIVNILVCLLQGCYRRYDITCDNYEPFLNDILKYRWHEEDKRHNLSESCNLKFGSLCLRDRVEVLLALCHYRLTASDVENLLQNVSGDSLRLEPLGHDASGSTYWYFYGTRLYKEGPGQVIETVNSFETLNAKCESSNTAGQYGQTCLGDPQTQICNRLKRSRTKRNGAKLRYPMVRRRRLNRKWSASRLQVEEEEASSDLNDVNYRFDLSVKTNTRKNVCKENKLENGIHSSCRGTKQLNDNETCEEATPSIEHEFSHTTIERYSLRSKPQPKSAAHQAIHSSNLCSQFDEVERKRTCEHFTSRQKSTKMWKTQGKKWELICCSYDEWKLLTETLSESKKKCEAELVQLIERNFLETIKELCLEKEKLSRRRLSLRVKENKIHSSSISEANSSLLSRHQANVEMLDEIEAERKLRENERKRLQLERALRHAMREKRLSMQSENDSSTSFHCKPKPLLEKKHVSALLKVLKMLEKHEAAWPFVEAVDDRYAPNYYDIVKFAGPGLRRKHKPCDSLRLITEIRAYRPCLIEAKKSSEPEAHLVGKKRAISSFDINTIIGQNHKKTPMDLMRIKTKLKSAQYDAVNCVVNDFNLIVENSITYNGPNNEYTELARILYNQFIKYMKQNGLVQAGSDQSGVQVTCEGLTEQETMPLLSADDTGCVESPEHLSVPSSDTVPYLSPKTIMENNESKSLIFTQPTLDFERSEKQCAADKDSKSSLKATSGLRVCQLFPSDSSNRTEINLPVAQSVKPLCSPVCLSSLPRYSAPTVTDTFTCSAYTCSKLPSSNCEIYVNSTPRVESSPCNVPIPSEDALKPRSLAVQLAHSTMPSFNAYPSSAATLEDASQQQICSQNRRSKCEGYASNREPQACANVSDVVNHLAACESKASAAAGRADAREVDASKNLRAFVSAKVSEIHASVNGKSILENTKEHSTRQRVEHWIQTQEFERGLEFTDDGSVEALHSSTSKAWDREPLVHKGHCTPAVTLNSTIAHQLKDNPINFAKLNVPVFQSVDAGEHSVSSVLNGFRRTSAITTTPVAMMNLHTSRQNVTNVANSQAGMRMVVRVPPPVVKGLVPPCFDMGLGTYSSVLNGEFRFAPINAFRNQPPCTFSSIPTSNFGGFLPGLNASTVRLRATPRIDNMLFGVPLIGNITPNGMPWLPQPVASVGTFGQSLLPRGTVAGTRIHPSAQVTLDYVAHRQPKCGLSPLVIHSPQSMSPRIPQQSCRPIPSSPVPPTSRLSISIPPPSPRRGSEYHRQPLGDGILTTQPPVNLFVVSPRTAVASGSLTGSPLFQWPCQPPVIHCGMLRLPPGS